jgi:hypothetical protein
MLKKSMAALLLVVVVAWAEMALAPMFIMQVWHVHPAREASAPMAAGHHEMPTGHRCCPGISDPRRKTENAPVEIAVSNLPCQDQHRCCFRQGPLNVPAPVSARQEVSRALASANVAELSPPQTGSNDFSPTPVASGPPPGLLGMILRV